METIRITWQEATKSLPRMGSHTVRSHPRRTTDRRSSNQVKRRSQSGKQPARKSRDRTLGSSVSSGPSPISQPPGDAPVDADAAASDPFDVWALPAEPEIGAPVTDDYFKAACPQPQQKTSTAAARAKAARDRSRRKAEDNTAREKLEESEQSEGSAPREKHSHEKAEQEALLVDVDEEELARERAIRQQQKLVAYEHMLDLLEDTAEQERIAARAHARRARQIEAARLATLKVEHDFPREEATDGSKTKGWTASNIGDRSFITMLATELRISEQAAEILVNTTRTLHTYFEPTLQLLETGNMSYRHAQIVVRESAPLSLDGAVFTAYETELLPFATTLTPPQFARKARAIATRHSSTETDAAEARHRNALVHRELTLEPDHDGMASLHLFIDAVAATAIFNRASDAAKHLKTPDDTRTLTQRRADVTAEILLTGTTSTPGTPTIDSLNKRSMVRFVNTDDIAITGSVTPDPVLGNTVIGIGLGSGITAQVSVHVPALTLLGHGTEPAYLEQYGPISLDTAKLLMGSVSTFTRVLTDPETGAVLSVGKARYTVPAAMRLWLLFRDGTCRFPGCTRPARACESDHVIDWQFGGETKVSNLASLCPSHHNIKHHTDWTYWLYPDGTAIWISPAGRRYTTDPANIIPLEFAV
jgi:hypothetical protein